MQIKINELIADGYTVTACYPNTEDLPKNVIKEDGRLTYTNDHIYIYFNQKEDAKHKRFKLKDLFLAFAKKNKYNVNIDVKSFYQIGGCYTLKTITEAILYSSHEEFSMKSKKTCANKIKPKYNLEIKKAHPALKDKADHVCIELQKTIAESKNIIQAVNFARDLQDMPPNVCYAPAMADKIKAEAEKIPGIKVTVLEKKDIEAQDMNLLLAVNAGSKYDPRVVILEYNNNPENPDCKLALVGKGVTFDTGGYNLKPWPFMKGMKFDMSGAAIATSALMAIARGGIKINALAIGCLVDNAIGAAGTLPESIIKSKNGKTVQIDNTDAEGRLILADGITYAIREKHASSIIEMSTLTGAILVALGTTITGVYADKDCMFERFQKAACYADEDIWRMPFHREFDKMITTTPIADIANIGGTRWGGANQAASFLHQFTEDKPFIHLDIAGSATAKDQRGKGVMVSTLYNYAKITSCCHKK